MPLLVGLGKWTIARMDAGGVALAVGAILQGVDLPGSDFKPWTDQA